MGGFSRMWHSVTRNTLGPIETIKCLTAKTYKNGNSLFLGATDELDIRSVDDRISKGEGQYREPCTIVVVGHSQMSA